MRHLGPSIYSYFYCPHSLAHMHQRGVTHIAQPPPLLLCRLPLPAPPPRPQIALHSVEEYDPQANTWTLKASLPEARFRFGAAVVQGVVADRVYAFGGHPTCQGFGVEPPQLCYNLGLATVLGYYDQAHPSLYTYVPAATSDA